MALWGKSAGELRAVLSGGQVTHREVVEAYFSRIAAVDPMVRSFVTLLHEEALGHAENLDLKGEEGKGLLEGVPVAIKDNLNLTGSPTTCASKILDGYRSPYTATAVKRLLDHGAIILGKTNLDEFAMGSSTENSGLFKTLNPWNTDYIPGGSSGGSAAAVAAGEVAVALGSDTGGSIRQPAACCGIVGLKPTYGRVSRYGLVAFASSLDQIGPLTRTVEDSARVLQVIAGGDPLDTTCADVEVPDYLAALGKDIADVRLGLPAEYYPEEGLDPEVRAAVMGGIEAVKSETAGMVEVSLPHSKYAVATYYIIATAEASSNLARFDGVRYGYRAQGAKSVLDLYENTRFEGFGPEVRRRILLGTYVLSSGYYDAYYLRAQQVRTLIIRDFEEAFRQCDVLVTPVMPSLPFRLGERIDDPLAMYLSDIYTISVNLAGIPAIVIPCGFSQSGLPIGLQLIAPHFQEEKLFRVARAMEAMLGVANRVAPVVH